jgi:hypothetical protein
MKCAKCGFVSFDYLSECKKCRTSMTAARNDFGFFAAKPAVPSLLGSLLSGYESPTQMESTVVETEMSTPFRFGEEVGFGFRREEPESRAAEAASAVVNPDVSGEDFSLLDLSDDELELLIDKESLESGSDGGGTGDRAPELLLADEPAPPAFEISLPEGEALSAAGAAPDELAQEFDDYPQGFKREPEITPTLELVPELVGGPTGLVEGAEGPAEFEPGPEQAWPLPDDSIDDFVIELTDNDLDALLEELSSTPKSST